MLECTASSQATCHELQLEEVSAREIARTLSTAGDITTMLDESMTLLRTHVQERFSEANGVQCQLEFLLQTEKQRVRQLEQGILESKSVAAGAMEECAQLAAQVQQLWEEKCVLDGKVIFVCLRVL